jgi:hypothetical protein
MQAFRLGVWEHYTVNPLSDAVSENRADDRAAARRTPVVIGLGATISIILGTYAYTGGKLQGWKDDETEAEALERKLKARARRRRPLEETIAEIGEGRGE